MRRAAADLRNEPNRLPLCRFVHFVHTLAPARIAKQSQFARWWRLAADFGWPSGCAVCAPSVPPEPPDPVAKSSQPFAVSPSVRFLQCVHTGGLPVPVHGVSRRARVPGLHGVVRRLAFTAAGHVAIIVRYQLGTPDLFFRSSITRLPRGKNHERLGVRMDRCSFPVSLSHSLLHAGFDRRTTNPICPMVAGFASGG
jgi:hypothetical protein